MEQADIKRNPDGTFAEGQSGNPTGRQPGRRTWQDYADRVNKILDEHTRDDLNAIIRDSARFDKYSSLDAIIIQNIVNALQSDGGLERERLLNRLIGKPLERAELSGPNGAAIEFDDAARRADVRRRLLAPNAADLAEAAAGEPKPNPATGA